MDSKICNKCHKERLLTEFYRNKDRKDGRLSICRYCKRKHKEPFVEIRCYKCGTWFLPKRINSHFCTKSCRLKHFYTVYNRSSKGRIRSITNKQVNKEKYREWHRRDYLAKKLAFLNELTK